LVSIVRQTLTSRQILRTLNSRGVTRLRRCAFPVPGVIRDRAKDAYRGAIGCQPRLPRPEPRHDAHDAARGGAEERQIAARVATLRVPPEFGIAGPDIQAELESCLALARSTQTMVASGERLAAARAAVDLVRAYDRVLDNIRLVPLSIPEQQRVRDQLAPVKDLLRKYRLR